MLTSLSFDTIAVHINRFYSDVDQMLIEFYKLGIKNFIFIFDYDPLCDSITILKDKIKSFKRLHSKPSSIRINIKCVLNMHISQGAGFNKSINKLYPTKDSNTLFVSLPLFTSDNYDPIALDINNLLYKKSSFLMFTYFDKIVETSSLDFCSKFINNSRIGFTVDFNYLFNPEKADFFDKILNSNSLIIPSVSQNMANYVGALSEAEFIIEKYGKKSYFHICSQINKASLKLFN